MSRRAPAPAARPPAPGLAAALVRWQRVHGRHDLPWQQTRDAYRVWLSEVMLQQTQVSTVLAYYPRFLARFPDVQALAAAPLDDVLALWSGLGYYSRARNLHRCAQVVVAEHGGRFPIGSSALARLPGIGRSTAAAIAAFCQGERAAILDGNVRRVLARVLGCGTDLSRPAAVEALWQQAEALLPEVADVPAYTQGLMDLGATLCTPRKPACERCPWQAPCVALAAGDPTAYPVKSARAPRRELHAALLWASWRGRIWLQRRPARGIWGGLWTLPVWPDPAALESASAQWRGRGEARPAFKHVLTHRDWWLTPWRWWWPASVEAPEAWMQPGLAEAGECRWVTVAEALAMGLPAPVRSLLADEPMPA